MNIKIDIKDLPLYKSNDLIPCECKNCQNEFLVNKSMVQRALKGSRKVDFCSRKCQIAHRSSKAKKNLSCDYCGNEFSRVLSDIRDEKPKFCSKICSIKFLAEKRKKQTFCKNCNNIKSNNSKAFCSQKCHKEFEYNENIVKWKNNTLETSFEYMPSFVRKYIFKKFNNSCSICGWNKINEFTMKYPLEIDHIDGNSSNNKEENLRLICPNCHSLTKTYKGANKGNGRFTRRKRYLNGQSF